MKKRIVYFLLAVLLIFLLFCSCFSQYRYPMGKDTAEAYGDGEYQVGTHEGNELLSNVKYNITVMRSIICREEIGQSVYFIGTDMYHPNYGTRIYGVLSLEENVLELYWAGTVETAYLAELNRLPEESNVIVYSSSDGFQEKDWSILQSLENGTENGR